MERYNITVKDNPFDGCPYADMVVSDDGAYVRYDDAQRALDAEREKAKQLGRTLADVYQQRDGLQAQLRQVEGQSKQQAKEAVIVFAKYTTLRQLVAQLPVLDMRFDSVAVGPLGWTVGGVTFGKVTEANAYSALLQYRATLAAQAVSLTEEQRHIEGCCDKPHDCKWGGIGGCGYEGRKHELKQAAPPHGGTP